MTIKRFRKSALIICSIILLTGILGVIGWGERVSITQSLAGYILNDLGFSNAKLMVRSVELDGLIVEDIQLGPVLTAEKISLQFTPAQLLQGQLDLVIIDQLQVDISNPDNQTFKQLQALSDSSADGGEASVFPALRINSFKIIERQTERSIDLQGRAEITPDLNLDLRALLNVTLKLPAGDVLLENGQITGQGSLDDLSGSLQLKEVGLRQLGDTPGFTPLKISANGSLADLKVEFKAQVTTEAGTALLQSGGTYDILAGQGQARYEIENLLFAANGLQPKHLVPALSKIPTLDARIDSTGSVSYANEKGMFSADTKLTNLKLRQTGATLNAASLSASLSGTILKPELKTELKGDFTIPALKIALKDPNLAASGQVGGRIAGSWGQSAEPIMSAEINVRSFGADANDAAIKNGRFDLIAGDIQLGKPIAVRLADLSSEISAQGRAIVVNANVVDFRAAENLTEAQFTSPKVSITPGQGAIFKPRIDAAINGAISPNNLKLIADLSGDLLGNFAQIKFTYNLANEHGSLALSLPQIPFSDDGITLADLLQDAPADMKVNGSVGADLTLDLKGSDFGGSGQVRLVDLTVEQEGVRLAGINGDLQLDQLNPFQTAPAQNITASLLDAGVVITEPNLTFSIVQINQQPVLKIDRMVMVLFGGGAEIRDAVIDPFAQTNKLDVLLSSLSLKELLSLGDLEDVAASGSVRGKIPLEFDGETLIVTNGILEAEGPGTLTVRSEAARQALSSGGEQTKLLFDILDNFNYSELSLAISKPASGEDLVTLRTKGANPDVENNRPVILNVNLSTNLDRIFNTLLDGYRLSEKALRATLRSRDK